MTHEKDSTVPTTRFEVLVKKVVVVEVNSMTDALLAFAMLFYVFNQEIRKPAECEVVYAKVCIGHAANSSGCGVVTEALDALTGAQRWFSCV